MTLNVRLGIVDYLIIGLSLTIAALIGIRFRISKKRLNTTNEYLLAGKNMAVFPVIMSVSVTLLSSVTILGYSSETYRYGIQYMVVTLGIAVGMVAAIYVFLPVYFNCNVSTTYEFLELRFGKITRYVISGISIIQMILFMSVSLYAPVLALSAVTDLTFEFSVIVVGLVCTFYCAIGGLRAVIWTDVFQAILIILCLLLIYVKAVGEAGGVSEIYKKSADGQRLNFFDFEEDFTKRYTFLNSLTRGFTGTVAVYGTCQIEVQRMLSLKSLRRAKSAMLRSIIPVVLLFLSCGLLGLVFYAVFNNCDPVADKANTGVTKYDQLVPYYIVTRFSSIPGLTGLCIAGIFSGSLSTVSSSLNSLASVTLMDFIKPIYKPERLSESRRVLIAKVLSLFYGVICIGVTFILSKVDSILSINIIVLSLLEGPTLAVFSVGVLTRKGTEKCILFGFLMGTVVMTWISCGIILSGNQHPSLALDTSGCLVTQNASKIFLSDSYIKFQELNIHNMTSICGRFENCSTTSPLVSVHSEPFFLYKMSFVWISTTGCLMTLFFIFIAIIATGWRHNVISPNSKCLSPVSRFWIKGTKFGKRGEYLDVLTEDRTLTEFNISDQIHTESNKVEV